MIQKGAMGLDTSLLSGHPLFCRVPEELLAETFAAARMVEVPAGETVYDRRSFRRCLGVVLSGSLQVRKESLLMSRLRAGDIFGAAALFQSGEDYPTTLTALEPAVVLLIPQEAIGRLLRGCGDFAEDYVTYLSGRIRFLSDRLDTLSAERGEGRLARYLLTAGEGRETVTVPAIRLGQSIGVGRATLYRAFEVLEERGAIARDGKTIRILDREMLRSLCGRGE